LRNYRGSVRDGTGIHARDSPLFGR